MFQFIVQCTVPTTHSFFLGTYVKWPKTTQGTITIFSVCMTYKQIHIQVWYEHYDYNVYVQLPHHSP